MVLQVRNIPVEGVDLKFSIPKAIILSASGKKDEIKDLFDQPVECELHVEPMGKDFFLQGAVSTTIRPLCSRCDEPFQMPLSIEAQLTLSPYSDKVRGSDSYQESDDGVVFFKRAEVDLDEVVREQLLLSLPMKYLCRETCQGLCPSCGVNLNVGPHGCLVKH